MFVWGCLCYGEAMRWREMECSKLLFKCLCEVVDGMAEAVR